MRPHELEPKFDKMEFSKLEKGEEMQQKKGCEKYEWTNPDYLNEDEEYLEVSRLILYESYEKKGSGTPMMFVEIDEPFGFNHSLYKHSLFKEFLV